MSAATPRLLKAEIEIAALGYLTDSDDGENVSKDSIIAQFSGRGVPPAKLERLVERALDARATKLMAEVNLALEEVDAYLDHLPPPPTVQEEAAALAAALDELAADRGLKFP